MSINELLSKIRAEILIRAGRGFTWEVNAEITKYEVYTLKEPTFWEDIFKGKQEWPWKLSKEVRDKKYISEFCRSSPNSYISNVDLDLSVTKELENQLPDGIDIFKKTNSVLYDGRNYRVDSFVPKSQKDILSSSVPIKHDHLKHINYLKKSENGYRWEFKGRKTCYIEGNRVYLTVSDDYANRIFNATCNSEYPFRNYLLEKHDQVLRDIALKIECSRYGVFEKIFRISRYGVDIRRSYEGDGCGYNWDTISFEEFGLTNLKTYEQLYGMAIALIDTNKKLDPEWTKASFYISHSSDDVHIAVMLPPPEHPKCPAIKLKEW